MNAAATPGAAIVEIREQEAERDRRDQVAQAAAGLDDRPVAARDREVVAFAIDRHARQPQRGDREVGGVIHQRRHQEVAGGHREEEERERIQDALRDVVAEHGPHQARHHRDERVLLRRVHAGRMTDQPEHPAPDERDQRQRLGLRHRRRESRAHAPDQPRADREDDVAVRERAGASPAVPQVERGLDVERDQRREAEHEQQPGTTPRRRDGRRADREAIRWRADGGGRVVGHATHARAGAGLGRTDGNAVDGACVGVRHVRLRWRATGREECGA